MRGYDEQYNCLVRFNVYTDLNSARAVADRNREVRYLADYFMRKAERDGNLADAHQYEANLNFISLFEEENMIKVEDDAREYLARYYKDARFGKLKKKLDRIVDREYEYKHLKDLAVVIMPDLYFKLSLFGRYEEIVEKVRDNYLGVKSLAEHLDVSLSSFRIVLRLDYVFDAYLQENILKNVKAVETTLYKKAIVDEDVKSILYVLSNRMPQKYSGEYSANVTVSNSAKDLVDSMSAEELKAMLDAMMRMDMGTDD